MPACATSRCPVPDPEKAAKFFEQAFGMKRAGKAGLGLYMTDGTINIALLKFPGDVPGMPPGKPYYGLIHFGMWVDDLDEAGEEGREGRRLVFHGARGPQPEHLLRGQVQGPERRGVRPDPSAAGRAP